MTEKNSDRFQYTARTLVGTHDTRHDAVGNLVQYGDWQDDSVVPIVEKCLVRQFGSIFVGPVHIGDKYWNDRQKIPTTGGVALIKSVEIIKNVNGQEKSVQESWWAIDCPVCHTRHEVRGVSEDSRKEVIDEMMHCCDIEWVPPTDWIEDCDVCGDSHRERTECTRLSLREPFPDPENHHYNCAECDWSGGGSGIQGPGGVCPDCGTTSVRAVEMATDGGRDEGRNFSPAARYGCLKHRGGDRWRDSETGQEHWRRRVGVRELLDVGASLDDPGDVCLPHYVEIGPYQPPNSRWKVLITHKQLDVRESDGVIEFVTTGSSVESDVFDDREDAVEHACHSVSAFSDADMKDAREWWEQRKDKRDSDGKETDTEAGQTDLATDGGSDTLTGHRSPTEDPRCCSRCGVYIGLRSGDYCDGCAREIGTKPPIRRCFGCTRYAPQEEMEPIDISPPDEYYPTIRYLCRDCGGGESQ